MRKDALHGVSEDRAGGGAPGHADLNFCCNDRSEARNVRQRTEQRPLMAIL